MMTIKPSLLRALLLPLRTSLPPRLLSSTTSGSGSGSASLSLTLLCVDDTLALGAALAELSRPGDAILLDGDYGAGKTCLARGFVRRWYADPTEQVTSPSYLIDNVYDDPEGRALQSGVVVHHMDLWRLPEGKIEQLVDLPKVFGECVSLIEWPERLGDALMPAEYLELRLEILGEEGGSSEAAPSEDVKAEEEEEVEEDEQPRIATLIARGDEWERRLEQIPILVERGQSENE